MRPSTPFCKLPSVQIYDDEKGKRLQTFHKAYSLESRQLRRPHDDLHQGSTGAAAPDGLVRSLGAKDSIGLVIGTVIGTGVFLKASVMTQQVVSVPLVLLAWLVAGVLSLMGSLCYAELGSMYPRAGGEYVFLREAYEDLIAFLYGWMRFWIGNPGSIAAYAVGAATFLGAIVHFPDPMVKSACAISFVVFFSLLNCMAVSFGAGVQNALTVLKILMIAGLAFAVLVFGRGTSVETHAVARAVGGSWYGEWNGWSAFATAMLAALWAYDGWNNMPMAAGEIKDPQKNIPRALGVGMAVVLLLYLLLNFSFFSALSIPEIQNSYSSLHPSALPVATRAAELCFGGVAVFALSIAFVISALGAMNGSILTCARIPYAMARDGLFFGSLGRLSQKGRVPYLSVLVQGVVASVLAMSGSWDQLTDYVVFAGWIFYALVTGSLFIFRRRLKREQAAVAKMGGSSVGETLYPRAIFSGAPIDLCNCVVFLTAQHDHHLTQGKSYRSRLHSCWGAVLLLLLSGCQTRPWRDLM